MMKKLLALLLFPLFFAGCTTTVTNLTASRSPRTQDNTYHFEALLDVPQQAIRKDTIQAFMLVGTETYPMQPTSLMTNRWETFLEIPADKPVFYYQYKFVYQYDAIPQPRVGSILSPTYQLRLTTP